MGVFAKLAWLFKKRPSIDKDFVSRLVLTQKINNRAVEIARLRRNKKKFSHLLEEQEADKAAINERRF